MILGKHTLAETRDYLEVADYRFKETGRAYDALATKPPALTEQWQKLQAQWAVIRKEIVDSLTRKAIASWSVPSTILATEPEFQRIAAILDSSAWEGGSLRNVTKQIEDLRGTKILYENQPSQNSPDYDAGLFQKLDATTRATDAAAEKAKEAAKNAATSNTGLLVGGTIIGTLALLGLAKRYL